MIELKPGQRWLYYNLDKNSYIYGSYIVQIISMITTITAKIKIVQIIIKPDCSYGGNFYVDAIQTLWMENPYFKYLEGQDCP
jgi:hypothetical protein